MNTHKLFCDEVETLLLRMEFSDRVCRQRMADAKDEEEKMRALVLCAGMTKVWHTELSKALRRHSDPTCNCDKSVWHSATGSTRRPDCPVHAEDYERYLKMQANTR